MRGSSGDPYFIPTLRILKSSFKGDCYAVLRTHGLLQAWTLTHHKTQHQLNIWILPAEDYSICLMEMNHGRDRRGLILQGCCVHVGQKPERCFHTLILADIGHSNQHSILVSQQRLRQAGTRTRNHKHTRFQCSVVV